VNGYSFIHTVQ